jgi:hypothetical protein
LTKINAYGVTMETATISFASTVFTIDPITAATVVPQSAVAGAIGNVDIAFTTTAIIPVGGQIQVLFPSTFGVAATAITSPTGIDASSTIVTRGYNVIITIAGSAAAAGPLSFTINGITNPGMRRVYTSCL